MCFSFFFFWQTQLWYLDGGVTKLQDHLLNSVQADYTGMMTDFKPFFASPPGHRDTLKVVSHKKTLWHRSPLTWCHYVASGITDVMSFVCYVFISIQFSSRLIVKKVIVNPKYATCRSEWNDAVKNKTIQAQCCLVIPFLMIIFAGTRMMKQKPLRKSFVLKRILI